MLKIRECPNGFGRLYWLHLARLLAHQPHPNRFEIICLGQNAVEVVLSSRYKTTPDDRGIMPKTAISYVGVVVNAVGIIVVVIARELVSTENTQYVSCVARVVTNRYRIGHYCNRMGLL